MLPLVQEQFFSVVGYFYDDGGRVFSMTVGNMTGGKPPVMLLLDIHGFLEGKNIH